MTTLGRHLDDRFSLPPGPRLPVAVQSALWIRQPLTFLARCERAFGGPFTLRLSGWGTIVMVWDPGEVRDLFRGEGDELHTGEANGLMRPLVGDSSIFVVDGDEHRRLRRVLGAGLRLDAFDDAATFHAAAVRAIEGLAPGKPVKLQQLCSAITLETIAATLLGMKPGPELGRAQTILRMALGPVGTMVASIRPLQVVLDRVGPALRLTDPLRELDRVLFGQIDRRRHAERHSDDMLSSMVAPSADDEGQLTDESLRDQLISLLVAGNETVASALTWALLWIHHEPGVLERLLEEIDRIDPRDATAFDGCTYLDAVVNESLRLCPVVELMSRATTGPFEFRGYLLPPGALLSACSYLSHRDPATFEDPERFDPDRFVRNRYSPYEFYPFGGGIRRCLGAPMALLQMKVVLSTILQERRVQLLSRRVVARRRNVIVAPGGGVPALLHSRQGE